jgi:hypothetical protein
MAWMNALAAQHEAEDRYVNLPTGHAEGSEALRKANRLLDQAAENYKSALDGFLHYSKRRTGT